MAGDPRGRARPTSVKAWLFGIARNLSIDELRRRRRVFPNEGLGLGLAELADSSAFDPSEVVETKELAELVWTSAAGLRAEEYALLDLHVRRGLSADELADSLGVRRGAVYTRLTRLRRRSRRRSPPRCSSVTAATAAPSSTGSRARTRCRRRAREVRRIFQAHVEDCARCQESKGLYASPAQILAGLALVPPPERARGRRLADRRRRSLAGAGAVAAPGKAAARAASLQPA